MSSLLIHVFSSASLISLGLYHLISSTRLYLRSSSPSSSSATSFFSARPFHSFQFLHPRLKHLPLYLLIPSLIIFLLHSIIISSSPDPLLPGLDLHRLSSLQSSGVLLLFLILSLSLLLSEIAPNFFPIPHELFFLAASAAFAIRAAVLGSSPGSGIESKCDAIASNIAAGSSVFAAVLAANPRLFVADAGLAASLCLQGLWSLQTGLSLYAEGFIPEGCHRLLDVSTGIEGSTKCDLEESRVRAMALLDLLFVFHTVFLLLVVVVVYAVTAKVVGVRRFGTYEPLVTTSTDAENLVQMRQFTKAGQA